VIISFTSHDDIHIISLTHEHLNIKVTLFWPW